MAGKINLVMGVGPSDDRANSPDDRAGDSIHAEVVDPVVEPDWDSDISRLPNASIFHTAGWCKVLKESYGYKSFYMVDRTDSHLRAVLPILEIACPFFGRRAVSLPFSDQCSMLGSEEARRGFFGKFPRHSEPLRQNNSTESAGPVWRQFQRTALARQWKSFECRDGAAGLPASQVYFEHVLGLADGADELIKRLKCSTRRALHKGEQSGLEIRMASTFQAVEEYYRLHCMTRKHHGLPPQPFHFFESIQRHILSAGRGFIVSAWRGSAAVSAAMFFTFGKKALYKFGASDRRFQELRGNNLVMWEAIKRLAGAGFETLDFGKTAAGNAGLRRFKLGWGAREKELAYSRFNFSTQTFSRTRNRDVESGWQKHVFRLMPMGMARRVGAMLYRHAG